MSFFNITPETTLEELKKQYHELSKLHHPDKGGDNRTQQEINEEYELNKEYLREYQRLNDPQTSIFDNPFVQTGIAMLEAALKQLNLGTVSEVVYAFGEKFIEKLPSSFDDYKPIIKLWWQNKCENPVESLRGLEKAGKELLFKQKKQKK